MNAARTVDAIFNVRQLSLSAALNSSSGTASAGMSNPASGLVCTVGGAGGTGSLFSWVPSIMWSASLPTYIDPAGNFLGRYVNWSRRVRFRVRFSTNVLPSANAVYRVLIGKSTFGVAAIGQLTAATRGIGFEVRGSQLWLTCANGTARTDTQAAGVTLLVNNVYEAVVDSDGQGNVSLLLNQSVVATNTGGPTSARTDFLVDNFSIEGTTADSTASTITFEANPMVMLS
jgi:hypothetical protein